MKLKKLLNKFNQRTDNRATISIENDEVIVTYDSLPLFQLSATLDYYSPEFLDTLVNAFYANPATSEEVGEYDVDYEDNDYDSEPGYDGPTDSNYCTECHNLYLIDDIINNTLKLTEPITPQQADTLVKLAQLKTLLVQCDAA